MTYQVYQNCTAVEWRLMKAKLNDLNKKILDVYHERLRLDESPKNADYLVLNYTVINDQAYLGNLAIMFKDEPGEWRFDISIVKALDQNGIRYFKKNKIADQISFSFLERNIQQFVNSALVKYEEWDKAAILGGEQSPLS
jgi:hypothetical protein